MGPEAAKSFLGQQLVAEAERPAERAKQEIDYGRRGKGYVFGAFEPATGDVLTWTAEHRRAPHHRQLRRLRGAGGSVGRSRY